jgi:hypothetical protein
MINTSPPSDRPKRSRARSFDENKCSSSNVSSDGKVNSLVQINVSVVNANRELKGVS